MDEIGRRSLPHQVPADASSSPEHEVFFITICCVPRGVNHLAHDAVWRVIDDTLRHRESLGHLAVRLALTMPDHLHGLFVFPDGGMAKHIASMKGWITGKACVHWQRDFFEHRIRSWESGAEKAAYIRQNPVRAGLVEKPEDWPYQR